MKKASKELDLASINKRLEQDKIILGSFPTWSLTKSDPIDENIEALKTRARAKNGDLDFYYGSAKNVFWSWYSAFCDPHVQPTDLIAIKESLKRNSIGITNIIARASRKGTSSFDYDLFDREYNHRFLKHPFSSFRMKILCTSKAVLNEMLLRKEFFEYYTSLEVQTQLSHELSERIYTHIDINPDGISQPTCQVLTNSRTQRIECVAIPSPGSPFRGLQYFGKPKEMSSKRFLGLYLRNVFDWFSKG